MADSESGKKKPEEKKKKLPLGRTLSNIFFALRILIEAAPVFLFMYIGSSVGWGVMGFLKETYLLRMIVNGVESGQKTESIFLFMLIVGLLSLAYDIFMNWFFNVPSCKYDRRMATAIERRLYVKAAQTELACYETPSFFDKYVKAMDEADSRVRKVMESLDRLVARVVSLLANSFLLFIIDPWLIVFGLFPLVLGIFRHREAVLKHEYEADMKAVNRRRTYIRRTFYLNEYAKEMRSGGIWLCMLRDLRDSYGQFKAVMKKTGWRRALLGYFQKIGLEVVTILGAMVYAVWRATVVGSANGGMSLGDCLVVLSSVGAISYCLNNLVQNFADFGEHALFIEDMRYFLAYEPKVVSAPGAPCAHFGDVTLKDVSFRYEGSETDTLHDVNMTWKKGERIALVGQNGSGKTTLVKLLLRLYDPTGGTVSLDGVNIKELDLNAWRDGFSTVFQDYKMFSLPVRDNVLMRPRREGDEALVEQALKESGAWEKVSGLARGMDTVLTREFDDKGAVLSGGEAQKVSLARIFADPTPYVILDEPSSALDPLAEYAMFENMMRATVGRSVIFISHRLSSALLADRIYLMEDGTIAECGTHHELMEKNGKYAEMFRRQAENYLGGQGTEASPGEEATA